MLGVLFGWRKASKCKKLIKKVQCRLKLLRNKRSAIVKILREDIALLLRNGHAHVAFSRLYMDENVKEVYELLDSFCEFVLMKLSYIRKHRDCPHDLNEAVSSLVFASARLGDLPELQVIRRLFGKFATSAVELLPGNLVNLQMIEKLSMNSVSDCAKNRLLDDIIRESLFQPRLLAIEYNRSPQVLERKHVKKAHEAANLARGSELEEKPENLVRATSLPERREQESEESDLGRSASLPSESPVELNRRALLSPRHLHPKLPDYYELEVKFKAVKKLQQESKL